MYEDFFKSLPETVDKAWLEKNYMLRLSTTIDDAMRHIENGNVAAAAALLGKAQELSDAIFDLRRSIDKK